MMEESFFIGIKMSLNVLSFTIYELCLSTIFGLLSIYLGQLFMCRFITQCKFSTIFEKGNTPLAIFSGTLILCLLVLTRTSILPSVSFLQIKASGPEGLSFVFFIKAFLYFLVFFLISFLSAVFLLFLSSKIVMVSTTDLDEIGEIKRGNLPVALLLSFVMVSFTFYLKPSLEHFLSGVVHYITSP